jgi:hypothetical protein
VYYCRSIAYKGVVKGRLVKWTSGKVYVPADAQLACGYHD